MTNDETEKPFVTRHSSLGFDLDFGFRLSGFFRVIPLLAVFACITAGCCTVKPVEPYYGPTSRMADVVAAINANNVQIPSLWANIDFSADVVDQDTSHHVGGSGVLIFRRPGDLLMKGGDVLLGPIFEVGSNAEDYWLKLIPKVQSAWTGSYANVGTPGVQSPPIRPDMLVEVLGVSTFNTNFLQSPAPIMRFDHDADAYEFTWIVRLTDRFAAQKVVRYDRVTLLPTRVQLLDENGRTMLRADLSGSQPVELDDQPKAAWPRVAETYDLFFTESKTRLKLTLSDVATHKGRIPMDATFRTPSGDKWDVPDDRVIHLDASSKN